MTALTNWVIKLGYKTIYTDSAKAYTICPDNLKQLLKQQVRWKKAVCKFYFAANLFEKTFLFQ